MVKESVCLVLSLRDGLCRERWHCIDFVFVLWRLPMSCYCKCTEGLSITSFCSAGQMSVKKPEDQ